MELDSSVKPRNDSSVARLSCCHSGEPRIEVRACPCRVTARGRRRNPEIVAPGHGAIEICYRNDEIAYLGMDKEEIPIPLSLTLPCGLLG